MARPVRGTPRVPLRTSTRQDLVRSHAEIRRCTGDRTRTTFPPTASLCVGGCVALRQLFRCTVVSSLLTALCVACATAPAAGVTPPAPGAAVGDDGREGATLEVENSSIFDVRVFVVRGGSYVRLGLVLSGGTTEFPL